MQRLTDITIWGNRCQAVLTSEKTQKRPYPSFEKKNLEFSIIGEKLPEESVIEVLGIKLKEEIFFKAHVKDLA